MQGLFRIVSFAALLVAGLAQSWHHSPASAATPAPPVAPASAHLPGSRAAAIIAPYAFDPTLNPGSIPLYAPAASALQQEGYTLQNMADATATLTVTGVLSLSRASGAGVLVVAAPGPRGDCSSLPIGALRTADEAATFLTRVQAHLVRDPDLTGQNGKHTPGKEWTAQDLTIAQQPVSLPTGQHATIYALGATPLGIARHWQGKDSLVYLATCRSAVITAAFIGAGASRVFGYTGPPSAAAAAHDLKEYWGRLDGSRYDGAEPQTSRVRQSDAAFVDSLFQAGPTWHVELFRCAAAPCARPLSLSPSVLSTTPLTPVAIGASPAHPALVRVGVTFSVPMRSNDPGGVLTASGCGAVRVAPSGRERDGWSSLPTDPITTTRVLTLSYAISRAGTLTLTVHSGSGEAMGAENGVALDGNQDPHRGDAAHPGPVRPNGDNYVWTLPCGGPTMTLASVPSTVARPTSTPTILAPAVTPTFPVAGVAASPTHVPATPLRTSPPLSPVLAPRINPSSITFPAQVQGVAGAPQTVTLINPGPGALLFSGVRIDGTGAAAFTLVDGTCTGNLAAGATCQERIAYTPAGGGATGATLSFSDNAPGSPQAVALVGSAAPPPVPTATQPPPAVGSPALSLSAGGLIFLAGQAGAQQTLSATNLSNLPLSLTVALTGDTTGAFQIAATSCTGTLLPGASCQIVVAVTPAAAADAGASLNILSGNLGQVVALQVVQGTAPAGSIATVFPLTLSFATLPSGPTPAQAVVLTNTGGTPLTITNIAIAGPSAAAFRIVSSDCPGTLAPQVSCRTLVTYAPLTTGVDSASLVFSDSAGDSSQSVSLNGSAQAPSGTALSLSDTVLTFGPQTVGMSSQPRTITLLNTGGTAIAVSGISLGGNNPSAFQVLGSCSRLLQPGQGCQVPVAFHPGTTGPQSATLSFAGDPIATRQLVALSGSGTAPSS